MKSKSSSSVVSLASAGTEALLREVDEMDAELGRWLAKKAAWFAPRLRGKRAVDGRTPLCSPAFWRGLILLWATSPEARAFHSSEAREGLTMAVISMDDHTILSLAASFLDEARRLPLDPAA
jgi:hypothetical protein